MQIVGTLKDARIAVVGAGAVGTSTAYRLAQAGASVTLIDANYRGGATSGNSFAWLNAFNKFPRHYFKLSTQCIRAHRDLQWELNGNWLTLNGGLHWQSPQGHSPFGDLEEAVRRLHGWGAHVESFSPAEIRDKIEPGLALSDDDCDVVYLVRDEGWVQPALMVQALIHRAVADYGATVLTGSVSGFTSNGEGINGVLLDSGERVDADLVVVAAGPATRGIAKLAGSDVPIETSHGLLAVTAPSPALLTRVVIAPDMELRPDGGGRILAASEAMSSLPTAEIDNDHEPKTRALHDKLQALVPGLRGVPFETLRLGTRALPADGHPIIGFDPEVNGLYYAVMHSGITLSAGVGALIAEDLADPEFDGLKEYRPDRFARASSLAGPSGE